MYPNYQMHPMQQQYMQAQKNAQARKIVKRTSVLSNALAGVGAGLSALGPKETTAAKIVHGVGGGLVGAAFGHVAGSAIAHTFYPKSQHESVQTQMHPQVHLMHKQMRKHARDAQRRRNYTATGAALGAIGGAIGMPKGAGMVTGAIGGLLGAGLGYGAAKISENKGNEMEQNQELTKEQQDLIAKQEKNQRRMQIATGVGAGLGATMGALKKGTKGQKVWGATKGAVLGGAAGYGLSRQLEGKEQNMDIFAILLENSAEDVLDALLVDETEVQEAEEKKEEKPASESDKLDADLKKAKDSGNAKAIRKANFAKFMAKIKAKKK